MKLILLLFTAVIFIICPVQGRAQITSVSQLTDVKPADAFYDDLQSLVERYGVINQDSLDAAANDTKPKPDISKGAHFLPRTQVTNRQLAMMLAESLRVATDLAGSSAALGSRPLKASSVRTVKGLKGLAPTAAEYSAMKDLIERYKIGTDLLTGSVYNGSRTFTEKEVSDILTNAFGVAGLKFSSAAAPVDRGRFVSLLNQALSAYIAKL